MAEFLMDINMLQPQGDNTQDPAPLPSQEPGRPSLGELSAVPEDDENDGFRTPTSTEHKIPALRECPPAPRKPTASPRAIPMKRKTTISKISRKLQFQEIEVLIPPKILASFLTRLMKPPTDERK